MHNTVLNLAAFAVEAVIGFFLISFFLGQLGAERYGLWVLIGSVFQYRGVLSLGLNSAVNRYIPVYLAHGDYAGVLKTVSTSFMYLLAMGIVLGVASAVIYFNFEQWFAVEPDLLETARFLLVIVGVLYSLSFPLQIFSATLSGLQRFDIINIVSLAFLSARTLLLVILLKQGYGLLAMGLLFGGSEVISCLCQFIYVKKLLPQATITLRGFTWKFLWESAAYGTNTLLYATGSLILFKAGNILIGIFMDTASISHFSIAVAAIMLMSSIVQVFSKAIKPAISDLDARNDIVRMKEIALLSQKYSLLIIIPSCFFLVAMGREFLDVWVGAKIQDASVLDMMALIMAIMAGAQAVLLSQHSNFVVMVGRGYHKIFGLFTFGSAAIFVALAVICLKQFNMGLIAVAWCNFIPIVLVSGIVFPLYFHRRMQIGMIEIMRRVWVPALWGTLPAVLLIACWKLIAPPQSWPHLAGIVTVAGALTLLCGYLLSLAPDEKTRILSMIRKKNKESYDNRCFKNYCFRKWKLGDSSSSFVFS